MNLSEYKAFVGQCLQPMLPNSHLADTICAYVIPAFTLAPDLLHDLCLYYPFYVQRRALKDRWPIQSLSHFPLTDAFRWPSAKNAIQSAQASCAPVGLDEYGGPDWAAHWERQKCTWSSVHGLLQEFYQRAILHDERRIKLVSAFASEVNKCRGRQSLCFQVEEVSVLTVEQLLDIATTWMTPSSPSVISFAIDGFTRTGDIRLLLTRTT